MNGAKYKSVVFVLAGVVGMAGSARRAVAGGQGAREVENVAAAQAVEATPESISFENVPVGELYTQAVRISNVTNSKVKITSITASSVGLGISGVNLPLELEPGGSFSFTVGYKPKAEQKIAGRISISTDASSAPLMIAVKGVSLAKEQGLFANQESVDFGVVPVGKKNTKELTLENGGNTDVTISKITAAGEAFNVSTGSSITMNPGQKANVELQFDPRSNGRQEGMISIYSNAQDSPMQVAVYGTGAAMSSRSVVLKWEESLTSVSGYNVYRSSDEGGSYTKLEESPITTATYTDTGLAAGQTYVYLIRAVDTNNVESDDSEQITVSVPLE